MQISSAKALKKLQARLRGLVGKAICEYNMIEDAPIPLQLR